MIINNEQTSAYMRKQGNEWVTDIRSQGVFIKTIPTPASQIRHETESLLWKKGNGGIPKVEDVEEPVINSGKFAKLAGLLKKR